MPPIRNLVGQRFGRLLVQRLSHVNVRSFWECLCDCGAVKVVALDHLTGKSATVSCGCHRREAIAAALTRHGMAGSGGKRSPEYRSWAHAKERCTNPNVNGWHYYGGRGVRMCEEWLADFTAFYEHIGPRPTPKHSVDRINVNGHYEPGNVRWATAHEQARNKQCHARKAA